MNHKTKAVSASENVRASFRGLTRLRDSDFVRKVAETFAARIALLLLGVATSIALTRLLGPEGRGVFAIASTLSAMGIQFGDLGLSSSNTYFAAKERALLPVLTGNALFVSLVMGTAAIAVMVALDCVWPDFLPMQGVTLLLALGAVPLGLARAFTQNLLTGIQDVRGVNWYSLWSAALLLALVAALGIRRDLNAQNALAVSLIATSAGWAWMLMRLKSHSRTIQFSAPALRRSLRYGIKSYATSFFAFMLLRSDMLLVGGLLGKTQAGLYAAAITLANLIFMLPDVVRTILFPRLSASTNGIEKWRVTRQALMATCGVVVISGGVSGLLARPVILRMYGPKFEAAVPAFLCLLPGMLFWSSSSVLSAYIASEGLPVRSVFVFFAAFALNLALNFAFLPRYGIVAASVNSSVCYGLAFAASWRFVSLPMRIRHRKAQE